MTEYQSHRTIADLKKWDANPRRISEAQKEALKRGLDEFGDLGCIVYNKRLDCLVGGHQRSEALLAESRVTIEKVHDKPTRTGEVAVGFIEAHGERYKYREVDWDADRHAQAAIIANKAGGEWDFNILRDVMLQLDHNNADLTLTGFDKLEVENLMTYVPDEEAVSGGMGGGQSVEGEDEIPDTKPDVPAIARRGDVFRLGHHRVMCGDSTSIEDLGLLMRGELANMVFTDPPYNIAYAGGTKEREAIANDEMPSEDFYGFLLKVYRNLTAAMRAGASIYVCHADTERVNFTKAFQEAGFHLSSVLIWAKNNATFGRQDYFWKHEPILYGWLEGAAHSFYGPNNEETVWNIDRPSRSEQHPTMKPVQLCRRAIVNSSETGQIVLDVFGGSGSTLIAAEETGRRANLMELEPKYVDVILDRWCKFTGKEAYRMEADGTETTWSSLKPPIEPVPPDVRTNEESAT